MQVKVKKIGAISNPDAETPKWENYTPGEYNGNVSLPVEYEIEGREIECLSIGKPYRVMRTKRNGVAVHGYFITSPVTGANINDKHATFTTKNSIYIVEFYDDTN